ncbi:Uncharacterized protein DAT39_006424 [Clarias magur]|uniref:Uncharacterized protein n=1 Tax=Clarias magur TaxID=1594786 RepID=A0A8J4UAW5_CLAMG|nr:Uncharacterized protein DAT39_006424 [Clarias magur]
MRGSAGRSLAGHTEELFTPGCMKGAIRQKSLPQLSQDTFSASFLVHEQTYLFRRRFITQLSKPPRFNGEFLQSNVL